MRIRAGYLVKVEDVGTPSRVVKTVADGTAAVVEFDFPEGKVQGTIPVSIISSVLSREICDAQA